MGHQSITPADIRRYAKRARLVVGEEDVKGHIEDLETQDEILSKLDELDYQSPPDREYWSPDKKADPNAAFLTRCDIQRTNKGLLTRQTVAIKDNIAVAGIPMSCGSPFMGNFVPPRDATIVDRLLDEGANIIGKANMDEFALGGDPAAMRYRLAQNPHEKGRMPGGSSAGSGVAVADGLVDVALGTDTGGSVRFPASFCGVVGVKPTRGLVSLDGFVQFSKVMDTIGTLSRTVEDSARTLQAMAGEDVRDAATCGKEADDYIEAVQQGHNDGPEDLTIGLPNELFGHESDIESKVQVAVNDLEAAGANVTTISIDDFEYAIPSWLAISMTEIAAFFESNAVNYWQPSEYMLALTKQIVNAFEDHPKEIGPFTEGALLYGEHLIDTHENSYYVKGQLGRRIITEAIDELFESVDVLACPTTPLLPPKWEDGYLQDNSLYDVVRNTGVFNMTGHPAVTVPCSDIDGLPVGLQFIAPHDADATALYAAAAWESLNT